MARRLSSGLNESPSEKEGKSTGTSHSRSGVPGLNESPSEKEGKFPAAELVLCGVHPASMKVPPKRKGNLLFLGVFFLPFGSLNESPSEKEGKSKNQKPPVAGDWPQ